MDYVILVGIVALVLVFPLHFLVVGLQIQLTKVDKWEAMVLSLCGMSLLMWWWLGCWFCMLIF